MWQICADTSWGMLYFNIKDFSIGKPQTWALGMTGTVFAMLAVRHFLSWRILSLVVPVFNRNGKKINKGRSGVRLPCLFPAAGQGVCEVSGGGLEKQTVRSPCLFCWCKDKDIQWSKGSDRVMVVRTYANRHKDQDTRKSNRLFDVSGGNQWPTNAAKLELRNHFIALCQPWSELTVRDRQGYRSLRTMQTQTSSFTRQIIFLNSARPLLLEVERCCWGIPSRLDPTDHRILSWKYKSKLKELLQVPSYFSSHYL